MSAPAVQDFMTVEPVTIAPGASVAEAAQLMTEKKARHLPVVEGDRLVGLISERDVAVARTLRSTSLDKATVGMLMNDKPLSVAPDAALSDVAARMIDRKVGSAIVVHEDRVVGIFTTHDALHALHRLAGERSI
jgi:acetoin utilization protein AcuB